MPPKHGLQNQHESRFVSKQMISGTHLNDRALNFQRPHHRYHHLSSEINKKEMPEYIFSIALGFCFAASKYELCFK